MQIEKQTRSIPRLKLALAGVLAIFMAASGCALNPFWSQGPAHKPEKVTPVKSSISTSSKRPADRTRCGLTPNPGRCRAAFQRYYFDTGSGKCKMFIWGGCGGTVPFKTLAECKADCEF